MSFKDISKKIKSYDKKISFELKKEMIFHQVKKIKNHQ
jgi:hypothetical protein